MTGQNYPPPALYFLIQALFIPDPIVLNRNPFRTCDFFHSTEIWKFPSILPPKPKTTVHGSGKSGKRLNAKRVEKVAKDTLEGISKPSLRRLARRGGVKRISGLTYEPAREALKQFLEKTIYDAVLYADCAKRTTVTANDVLNALKRQNKVVYGYGR